MPLRFDAGVQESPSNFFIEMSTPKVLVADPISERGIAELLEGKLLEVDVLTGKTEAELLEIIGNYQGLVVRSQTKVTARLLEAATQLKAVGRAGVGVDNVDVEAATKKGVIVMNTPGGNTVSTAEHTFSLMMAISRNIAQADASVKSGKCDRKSFEGVELYGKTLAILGMGRIGTEVASRAQAFGMRVLAYDPYLSAARAKSLHVELVERLDEIVPQADYITVHMPLTPETKHMLNAERLQKARKGVRIINCARGGLIDEAALYDALKSRHVAAAALDVFEVEPPPANFNLRELPNVVFTPHLGASTAEASNEAFSPTPAYSVEVARSASSAPTSPENSPSPGGGTIRPRSSLEVRRSWVQAPEGGSEAMRTFMGRFNCRDSRSGRNRCPDWRAVP